MGKHERLSTGRPDDGKADMCRCGTPADFCASLHAHEVEMRGLPSDDDVEAAWDMANEDRLIRGDFDADPDSEGERDG